VARAALTFVGDGPEELKLYDYLHDYEREGYIRGSIRPGDYVGGNFHPISGDRIEDSSIHGKVYGQVCASPCKTRLPMGEHRFALSQAGGTLTESEEPVRITGPGTLYATYTSRRGYRIVGWSVIGAAITGGFALALTSHSDAQSGAALAVGVVGIAVGAFLGLRSDTAEVTFVPMNVGSAAPSADSLSPLVRGASAQGAGLRLAF
jgi:hypothetical protein